MLRGRVVFLVSPEAWDFLHVSKHHFATELAARGNLVYFINPPTKQVPNGMTISSVANNVNLRVVDYSAWFRGLRFFPGFFRRWMDRRFLRTIQRQEDVQFDVIWNFENSRFFDLRFAGPDALKIYFQVDEDQNYHPATAAGTADIALAINSEILEIISPYNPKSFLIPHSFQGNLSEQARQVLAGEFEYHTQAMKAQVMYVGNLEHGHIDVDLFEAVVRENQFAQFNLAGPYDPSKPLFQRLQQYENVRFLGKIPYQQIPAFFDTADALMLVYGPKFTQSSHKLLEYLASGKAIVSTYMKEYDVDQPLLYMSKSSDAYLKLFTEVISDLKTFNAPALMRRRIEFALRHTYSSQLDRIESLITN
jgi:glycosyltransferase involved in cell wall biosynthesis